MDLFSTDLQTRLGSWLLDRGGHLLAYLSATPPARHGITCHREVAYGPLPEHRLDVWCPPGEGPFPGVLYLHGGGFRVMSKDTHPAAALALARQGRVVFTINYRLAPQHRFPAGLQDVVRAWRWLHDPANSGPYPVDRGCLSVAGDSAGANLSAALTLAACWPRPEPWAQPPPPCPRAVVGLYGIFQVTDTARYWQQQQDRLSWIFRRRIRSLPEDYLGRADPSHIPGDLDLADPVVFLERAAAVADAPAIAVPPLLLPTGTADPLLQDARRMAAAWPGPVSLPEYPGEPHGFATLPWRAAAAAACWADIDAFLKNAEQR